MVPGHPRNPKGLIGYISPKDLKEPQRTKKRILSKCLSEVFSFHFDEKCKNSHTSE